MFGFMRSEIISIGTELTAGMTLDTNAAWLARRLSAVGIAAVRHVTVSDDRDSIRDAVVRAAARAGVVLVTGGLGPTADDLTREALADAAGRPLVVDEPSLTHVRGYFQRIEREMPEANRRQAYLPEGAVAIENPLGTAPGVVVRVGGSVVYAMPGVPLEMRAMYERSVEPELAAQSGGAAMVTRTVHSFGASEARVAELIEDLMVPGREPTVGITACDAVISVRVIARGATRDEAETVAEAEAGVVRDRLGSLVFGAEGETLGQAVARVLCERGLTVATAESCTGGLLAKHLTDVSGSSAYYLGGFVTYGNEAKSELTGVPASMIAEHGAVSEAVGVCMAEGCRVRLGADLGLSTTGIAGPTGGTADKPVGLVYVALATASGTIARRLLVNSELGRGVIRQRSCNAVLNLLRRYVIWDLEIGTDGGV